MNKLYVLVRKDLSHSYRMVQGGHAIAEWCIKHPGKWMNETLIVLEVKNERQLVKWIDKLSKKGIEFEVFKEPDLGNQITSISSVSEGCMFEKLRLA